MIGFLQWIFKITQWLYIEFRLFWLCFAVVIASVCVVISNENAEATIRITGMLLQLGGVFTVAWGIRETRKLFKHPNLLDLFKISLKRFPLLRQKQTSANISCTLSGALPGFSGSIKISNSGILSIEERVTALEERITIFEDTQNHLQSQIRQETQRINSELSTERQNREEEDLSIHRKLEAAETGGLRISTVGLIWLSLGVILTSIPDMIMKFTFF